jgi:hypothetical protein
MSLARHEINPEEAVAAQCGETSGSVQVLYENGNIVNAYAKLIRKRVEYLLDHLGEAFAYSFLVCSLK